MFASADDRIETTLFLNDGAVETGSFDFDDVSVVALGKDCDLTVEAFERVELIERRLPGLLYLENLDGHLLARVQIECEFDSVNCY